MTIKNIRIKNFKSIKELDIPFKVYGNGKQRSSTTFLVGINESGKSSILEAISLINVGFSEKQYEDYCSLEAQEAEEFINITTELELELEDVNFWKEKVVKTCDLEIFFVENMKFIKIIKNTYLGYGDGNSGSNFEIDISEDLPFNDYTIQQNDDSIKIVKNVERAKKQNEIEEVLDSDNMTVIREDIQEANSEILTKEILEKIIGKKLNPLLNNFMPSIQIWKPKSEYLINETIDLNEFKENPNISIPLKNIFNVFGKLTDAEIKKTIERALSEQARTDELKNRMSDKITKHINNIWKEHKITIKISINGSNCQVHIEDQDKKFTYYKMKQRSDGFKQFISLILSLSTQNDSNNLRNKVILIDEPEVHLHPSGIRYMRDEILKIGKNNYVIVATHSQYMVDTTTPERHWIVKKEASETSISEISNDTPVEDDSVLATAFGLNFLKELLPKNILIVEGQDDKSIISHSIKLLKDEFFYSIKSAGGASKMPGFASLLEEESIPSFFLFDSDKEGKNNKNKILKNHKNYYSEKNIFTLTEINPSLPTNSTIEDLLPIEFVKAFFNSELNKSFELSPHEELIIQLKRQDTDLNKNKEKLDSLKIKLAIAFCEKYTDKSKLQEEKRLYDFINNLIERIKSDKSTGT